MAASLGPKTRPAEGEDDVAVLEDLADVDDLPEPSDDSDYFERRWSPGEGVDGRDDGARRPKSGQR